MHAPTQTQLELMMSIELEAELRDVIALYRYVGVADRSQNGTRCAAMTNLCPPRESFVARSCVLWLHRPQDEEEGGCWNGNCGSFSAATSCPGLSKFEIAKIVRSHVTRSFGRDFFSDIARRPAGAIAERGHPAIGNADPACKIAALDPMQIKIFG